MENQKKNVLVTLADANFLDQAKQLFSSVYFNAGWEGDYLLMAQDIPESDLTWFRNKGILVYQCTALANQAVGILSHPPVVLAKLYLFTEYFKQWDRVIFLDADIIVRSSFNGLLTINGFGASGARSLRFKNEFVERQYLNTEFKKKYKLTGRAFNSGFLVIDTSLITKEIFNELMALYRKFEPIYVYNEESLLNLFFYRNWRLLPIIYNSVPWMLKLLYNLRDEEILVVAIHFVCCVKPWDKTSPYYEEWSHNLLRAEEINLNNRPQAAKPFTDKELNNYLRVIRRKDFIFWLFSPFKFIDSQIGELGLSLQKKSPKLYKIINLKQFLFWRPENRKQ